MATMKSLYGKLNKPVDVPETTEKRKVVSHKELSGSSDPDMISEIDNNNEISIQNDTNRLVKNISTFEGIVTAAYDLREYVPNTTSTQQEQFWKERVSRFCYGNNEPISYIVNVNCRLFRIC